MKKYIKYQKYYFTPRKRPKNLKQLQNVKLKKNAFLREKDKVEVLEELLNKPKPYGLDQFEREALFKICKLGMNKIYRKNLWLKASGALQAMKLPENQNYYHKLKKLELPYPNPSFAQIELDLKRTFYELRVNKTERLINKLRNVLKTYCKRNPTIGYC